MTVARKTQAIGITSALFAALSGGSVLAQSAADAYGPQPVGTPFSQPAGPMPQTIDPASVQAQISGPMPQSQPQQPSMPARETFAPVPVQPSPAVPPDSPVQPTTWQILNQAKALLEQNQPNRALPLIREFIGQRPLEPEGYFWEGVALDNLQQVENALTAYARGVQQVLKAGMDSAELRMNAANDLLKLKRLDLAIEQYKRAALIDPGLAIVQLNLGRALVEKDDIDGALQCFQRCEDLHFTPYQLSYYRAKALKKVGRTQDAKAQVLMALSKLDASSDASAKLRQEFAELLNAR